MYAQSSIKRYLDDLAARKPAPGGGSAAALGAAIACALMSMVANYTISNKKYKDVKEKALATLKKSEQLRSNLLHLVDEDVRTYAKLSKAVKKTERDSSRLGAMYTEACNVPFKVCKITAEALELCRELVEYGNKNLITDTAIAALMLESAFLSAKFNVYVNLKDIKDRGYIEKVHKILSGFEDKIPKFKNDVLHKSENVIIE